MADRFTGDNRGARGTIPAEADGGIGLFALLAVLLRRRRMVIGVPLATFTLAVLILLVVGRKFSADSTFKPQMSEPGQSRLSGLAAQFGFALPGAALGDPVRFYSELAKSRELLTAVVNTTYRIRAGDEPADTAVGNLIELFKVKHPRPEDRMRIALTKLRSNVIVTVNRDAGLVFIRTISKWPDLSTQINRRILDLLNDENMQRRQSQAAAEREFVEGRLRQSKSELEAAEAAQAAFLARNRRYQDAPELRIEFQRLQRRIDLSSQVYAQLAQSYEQARIDEVRNTPTLVIIDRPEGSARRYGSRAKDALVALFLGCVLAIMLIAAVEYLGAKRRSNDGEYAALRAEARAALGRFARRR